MSVEAGAAALAMPQQSIQMGYGASLTDAAQFHQALHAAGTGSASGSGSGAPHAADGADAIAPAMKGLMGALEHVNGEASSLGKTASALQAKGMALTPGEMVMLTVRCQEFAFHCQLTSNIANRTSDGLQQLFRQQG